MIIVDCGGFTGLVSRFRGKDGPAAARPLWIADQVRNDVLG